ncbi:MAG: hypothetical protein JXR68_09370 [Bacteroidales bacterium]|nr:hypothetical protein [Bacteroidales bacterium]
MNDKYMDVVQYFADHHSEFMWQVLFPIFFWLVLVLAFFVVLFIKYTFGNWSSENPNPYQDETWGMPRGTFRGILTLTLVFVTVILELVNVRIVGFETEMHEFMVAFQMMIAFYFGSKVMHHVTSADKQKTYAVAGNDIDPQGIGSQGIYDQSDVTGGVTNTTNTGGGGQAVG